MPIGIIGTRNIAAMIMLREIILTPAD